MSNINFANPWLLLVGILLLIIVIVSYLIVIRKENRTRSSIISFVIHIVMCILISLAVAKTTYEQVITETNIYVLADVSYSSNRNLDLIDEYIEGLEETSPKNSKIGIVCFGNDYELLVKPGENLKSVKESKVDDSQTNIAKALEYTGTLFKNNVIKRIVIISDGKETTKSNIVSLVQNLALDNVYVDAIYLDNNLKEEDLEVQISSVDYVDSTYLDNEEKAYVLVQSNTSCRGYIELYCDDTLLESKAVALSKGYNTINFGLKTDTEGIHRYEVKINMNNDTSEYNNSYLFIQEVVKQVKVLVVSNTESDREKIEELYGTNAVVDYYINQIEVPYSVEELCQYDEFILSNIDVRTLKNAAKFINSLDILVSEFGKSLTTFGNTHIQNNYDNPVLASLSDMLPVKFGNGEQEEKLVTLVLDISRSMEQISKFHIAKECVNVILDNLDDKVKVMVYVFYGKNYMAIEPTFASNRESIKEKIQNLEALQGTIMGSALKEVYQAITSFAYSKNEVILISDGLPYGSDDEDREIKTYANKLAVLNTIISTIHIVSDEGALLMKDIAEIGRGYYYYIKELDNVKGLILNEVLNALNEVILEGNESTVQVLSKKDPVVLGVENLPNLKGLFNNQKKASSTVLINATYTDITGYTYEVPLYSYWDYGNGKVSSFASTLTGNWNEYWKDDPQANRLFANGLIANRPLKSIDSSFIVSHLPGNVSTEVTVKAPSINKDSKLFVTINYPKGNKEVKELVFDGKNYIVNVDSTQTGEYKLELIYNLGELNYSTEYLFNVSYLPEYNSFAIFEASNLYYMVSTNGQISEDGKLELKNDDSIVQKYIVDFTPICMILCVILFIIDIVIRKLRIEDIKSFIKLNLKQIKKEKK